MDLKTTLSEDDRKTFMVDALRFVAASRSAIKQRMANGYQTRTKADSSFVTDADTEAEQILRSAIAQRYPEHGIIGEELEATNPDSDFQWILDPIDGTLSFIRSIPLWGTIVALHYRGQPVVGIIDHPALDRCYSAAVGLGSFCNGRRVQVKDLGSKGSIDAEIISTGDRSHFMRSNKEDAFDLLMRSHPQVRSYADCFGHTLAVSGSVGAMVDFGVRIWDIGATQVLVEEAGGKYVCASVYENPAIGTVYGIIFGKPEVVDWLLPLFA